MKMLVENWYIIIALVAVFVVAGCIVYRFLKLPTTAQIEKVKAWLLWAVTNAEKELGGGTGKLKLRQVDTFSQWVEDALAEMRKMLDENKAAELVKGAEA